MSFLDTEVRSAASDDKRVAQIKKAFEVFTDLIRTQFEPLAQVLTRKSATKVVPHPSSSFTDGKKISLRVPLELGRDTEHTKHLCGVRDEDGAMYCPACYVLDDAVATVAHEISHIVYDSFTEIDSATIEAIFEGTLKPRIEAVDPTKVASVRYGILLSKTAMEVASKCDAWLPMVTNALEDVFVNESMYASRPGFRDPIRGTTIRTIMKGFLQLDGTVNEWKDSPKDARAIMVAYAIAADIEKVIPSISEGLEEVIADEKLRDAVTKIHSKVTAQQRLELALQTLEILRSHGLCIDNRSIVFAPPTFSKDAPPSDDGEAGESDDGEPGEEAGDMPGAEDDPLAEKEKGKGGASKEDDEEAGDEPTTEDDDQAGTSSPDDADEDADDDDDEAPSEGSGDDDTDEEADDAAGSDEGDDDTDDKDDDTDSSDAEGNDDTDADDKADDEGDDDDKGDARDDDDTEDADFNDDDYSHDGSEPEPGHDEDMPDERDQDADDNPEEAGADSAKGSAKDVSMDDSDVDMEEVEKALKAFMGHGDDEDEPEFEEQVDRELAKLLLDQADLFDDPSFNVRSVKLTKYTGIRPENLDAERQKAPKDGEINPVLNELRVAFTANAKVGMQRNMKSGPKLDGAHLYRVALDDPRLFARRSVPKKRSWAVTIGMDMSGSTGYGISSVIKNGGYAMAELLTRLGIPFSMYGHSGNYTTDGRSLRLDMFHVKTFDDQWNAASKDRCLSLTSAHANLDGHTLEFYRRSIQERRETDKLIIYFTDGAMPAENYDEELTFLQRNIVKCQRQKIRLLGVGVGTDSPKRHGLDTVRYDSIKDLPNLIKELGKRLA